MNVMKGTLGRMRLIERRLAVRACDACGAKVSIGVVRRETRSSRSRDEQLRYVSLLHSAPTPSPAEANDLATSANDADPHADPQLAGRVMRDVLTEHHLGAHLSKCCQCAEWLLAAYAGRLIYRGSGTAGAWLRHFE
jgi:hypothetical protein